MASSTPEGWLTNSQVVLLAANISSENMKAIATGYLDLEIEVVQNLATKNGYDQEGFTRDVIEKWKNKPQNSDHNQVKRLASILYQVVDEGGYVDPDKILNILKVSREDIATRFNNSPVTEGDLNDLAAKLRPITVRRSNIDMIQWAENNKVKMEDLYTELKIDKLENKPVGVESTSVEDYKDLFTQGSLGSARRVKGKRLLGKGDPGNGKTTFMRKVAWDWAKGILTAFALVFFISLKLVSPGDLVENIIIEQNPELEGLKITDQKLKGILETFGSHCLIILDGYDEHISGGNKPNKDIVKMLKGQKFLFCNVFLTSRPHSIAELEELFSTVVSIQGFTEKHAREFASRVLVDKEKIDPIMEIQCLNAGDYISRGNSVFTCPLLLLFICVLVNGDEIDLARKEVTLGEIYTRVVRCLYKKYTVRKGINFKQAEFVEVLRKVGSVAYKYLFGRRFAQRSEILMEVGEDAFDYGLLLGHEDFRLSAVETFNILISFPHRTIQEFLGTLWYILNLDNSRETRETGDFSDAMVISLFFHFSLWFLGKHCTEEYFLIENKDKIYEGMERALVNRINFRTTHTTYVFPFPAFNFRDSRTDKVIQEFFQKSLSKCNRVKHLELEMDDPIGRVMNEFRPLLPQLSLIKLGVVPMRHTFCSEELRIAIGPDAIGGADELLACCTGLDKPLSMYFFLEEARDLSKYFTAQIASLDIAVMDLSAGHCLSGLQHIPYSPHLTRLTLEGQELDDNLAQTLSRAVEARNLPNIRLLCFEHCNMKGKLQVLFGKKWVSLTHLHMYGSHLHDTDVQSLLKTSELLPNLTSLELFLGHEQADKVTTYLSQRLGSDKVRFRHPRHIAMFDMFESTLSSITELWMYSMNKQEYKKLISALNRGALPQLRELGISMWEHVDENIMVDVVTGHIDVDGVLCDIIERGDTLDWLSPVNILTLTHLTLHRFICTMYHLDMATQSTVLTKLHKLDISHSSRMTGTLSILLCHKFPLLNTLVLSDCGLNSKDLCSLAQARAKDRLPDLKHLDISRNDYIKDNLYRLFPHGVHWENLNSLIAKNGSYDDYDYDDDGEDIFHRSRFQPSNELIVSDNSINFLFRPEGRPWKNIREVHIYGDVQYRNKISDEIIDALERGMLPALKSIMYVKLKEMKKEKLILQQSIAHLLPSSVIENVLEHIDQTLDLAFQVLMSNLFYERIEKSFDEAERSGIWPSYDKTTEVVTSQVDMSSLLSLVEDQHLTESQNKELTDAVRTYLGTSHVHRVEETIESRKRIGVFTKYDIEYLN